MTSARRSEPSEKQSTPKVRKEPTADEIYNLGLDRYHGRDYAAARDFFLQSAEMGNPKAQYAVGFMLYQHTNRNLFTVHKQSRNDNVAFDWWTKAAEQGHTNAQYMLGIFYQYAYCNTTNARRGNGLSAPPQEAIRLHRNG